MRAKLSEEKRRMSKTFRSYDPEQILLMPASLQDWLPKGHLAYFISDVVDHLDLSALMSWYEEEKGYPPYHPAMMVKVLLYACCIGVPSSRKIEKRLEADIGFRVLQPTTPIRIPELQNHTSLELVQAGAPTFRLSGTSRS
ncbi:MAG: hypothetical protein A2Y91_07105 [Chloroflexi bacterium RBG_13_54_8]|nr:MAG: hypothetical protein A2Y91_07105 [Chloroflexi bacterium RBG_13_54_8]